MDTPAFALDRLSGRRHGHPTSTLVRSARLGAALLFILFSVGCASRGAVDDATPATPAAPEAFDASTIVATDLVSVLMQLRELSPFATTVQTNVAISDFGKAVVAALEGGGYGVQQVSDDQGTRYVRYSSGITRTQLERYHQYAITVGDITVSRDYALRGRSVFPTTDVSVQGAAPTQVILSDDLFRQQGGEVDFPAGIEFRDRNGALLEQIERYVSVTTASERASGERYNGARYLVLARSRLFTADRANVDRKSNADAEHRATTQAIIAFQDRASMVLGMANKRAIRDVLTRFDAGTDRFTITACAHNDSLLWDGTESVSLERSMRVKEELLLLGTPRDAIREESCFATTYADRLQPQSVVLTLERRADSLI